MKTIRILCSLMLLLCAVGMAQEPALVDGPKVMVLNGAGAITGPVLTTDFAFRETMRGGEFVKGAPYTATAVTETTQALADGNRIVNKSTALLARDSEGRMRREETMSNVGRLHVNASKLVIITDPVAKAKYVLNVPDQTAQIFKDENAEVITVEQKQAFAKKHLMESKSLSSQVMLQPKEFGEIKRESLGTEMIEGLSCDHLLTTQTIPAGAIGNERPIVVTSESWAAPDMHLVVMIKRADPRFGESVYKLTNITRSDPDPSLFQVPGNFKVLDALAPLRSPLE
jgi:hypothetical protein